MPEYSLVSKNGQITLPDSALQKAKIKEGDLLEAVVDTDGTILLHPKLALDRTKAENYQLEDIDWAVKQKDGT
jgi:AbrB family looped-hinge helix DNA binding protein